MLRRTTVMKNLGIRIPEEKDVGQEGDVPKKTCQGGYYNKSNLQVWKDRCLRKDGEMKRMANKLADLQSPPFPLEDKPIPAAKNDAQKGGQKSIPVVPQHDKAREHSHRLSREVDKENR
ncbi:hypothetical protein ACSBR2_004659 [Camellia fascicularis]